MSQEIVNQLDNSVPVNTRERESQYLYTVNPPPEIQLLIRAKRVAEIEKLLPKVLDKMFPSRIDDLKWGVQAQSEGWWVRGKALYKRDEFINGDHPVHGHIVEHFMQYLEMDCENHIVTASGEISFALTDKYDRVKSFCAYATTPRGQIEIAKFTSMLIDCGVEFIVHSGGVAEEYPRVWFFCDTTLPILRAFINRIINDADIRASRSLQLVPTHTSRKIPIPGGYDLKAKRIHAVSFRGKRQSDAIFVMKSIINCRAVSEETMLRALKTRIDTTDSLCTKRGVR